MEKLQLTKFEDEDVEEIPDDFQCCVCLDLLYKPVVLACGHIACFWCVFKAMDTLLESHCMVCRHPYNHFPRICKLMHDLLLKLYPLAYKQRERQVSEEEKKLGYVSPQFDNYSTEPQKSEGITAQNTASPCPVDIAPNSGSSSGDGDFPSKTILPNAVISENEHANSSPNFKLKTTSKLTPQKSTAMGGDGGGADKPVLPADLSCSLCKQLLCQPVVLNCGDIFCEACIKNPGNLVHRCPVCHSAHPSGFPSVCLVLEHFLEERLPEDYAARKHSITKQVDSQQVSQSSCSQDQPEAAEYVSVPTNHYASWLSGLGPKVHLGVGCDYCGMCPIIGERYRCKDCVERIGFDLCEQCYRSSAKMPGRFNQQHTEDHQFQVIETRSFRELILRHEAESFSLDSSGDEQQETGELVQSDILSVEVVQEVQEEAQESQQPSPDDASEHQERRV